MNSDIEIVVTNNTSKVSFKGKTYTIKSGDSMKFQTTDGMKFIILWRANKIQVKHINMVDTVCESWFVPDGLKLAIVTNLRPLLEDGTTTICAKAAIIVLSHPIINASLTKNGKKEKKVFNT